MSVANALWRAAGRVGTGLRLPELVLRGRPRERRERLGLGPEGGEPAPLWVHAASVGELDAARPLLAALRKEGTRVALSAMTRTGREKSEALHPDVGPFHAPLDAPGPVRRCLDRLHPRGLVVLETELWPTLLGELDRRGVPWAVASARLSERAHRRMRRALGLYSRLLASASAIAARTEDDARRYLDAGAPADAVRVTGDLKEDRPIGEAVPPPDDRPRWIAACTRPGEEELALDATAALRGRWERGELILAPRHPERFDEVKAQLEARGEVWRPWARRDDVPPADTWTVLLVDEMGVLDEAYARAWIAFVGGSLVPCGGHSPLQAAAAARPVLFGPDDTNCSDAVALLENVGALRRVTSGADLANAVDEGLADPKGLAQAGRAGHAALRERAGATRRTIEFLQERGVLT